MKKSKSKTQFRHPKSSSRKHIASKFPSNNQKMTNQSRYNKIKQSSINVKINVVAPVVAVKILKSILI